MKKILLFLLLLLMTLSFSSALAFHEHVDIDGAETLISGYRAPTETEDGTTGDEVCSVCGEIIKKGTVIPAVGKQREKAKEENITPQPPKRTKAPETAVTPVPTARPTKEPTPPPTKVPPRETPEPAEPVPAPKQKTPQPTPQPDLSGVKKNAAYETRDDAGSSYGSFSPDPGVSSRSGSSRRSSSAGQPSPASRDLEAYPIFSSRFPWRRLFMNPEPNIVLTPAGVLIWPAPAASSPLMMLQIPDLVP